MPQTLKPSPNPGGVVGGGIATGCACCCCYRSVAQNELQVKRQFTLTVSGVPPISEEVTGRKMSLR